MNSGTYLILLIILFAALVFFYGTVLFKFYRYLIFRANIFGNVIQCRLFTLLATSFVFNIFFIAVFMTPLKFLYYIISRLLSEISTASSVTGKVPGSVLSNLVQNLYAEFSSLLFDSVLKVYVLFGFVFAMALNLVIKALFFSESDNGYVVGKRLKEYFVQVSKADRIRQNIALAIVLTGSLYLAMCAIIAIPYNSFSTAISAKDSKADAPAKEAITMGSSFKVFKDYRVASNWSGDSVKLFTELTPPNDSVIVRSVPPTLMEIYRKNQSYLASAFEQKYKSLNAKVQRLEKTIENLERDETAAIALMDGKLKNSSAPAKLKEGYAETLRIWFANKVNNNELVVRDMQSGIQYDVSVLKAQTDNVRNKLKNLTDNVSRMADGIEYSSDNVEGYRLLRFDDMPVEPRLGTDWGPLGNLASWLIMAQSLDLVLIVGMFGFGLLGAAISSFIVQNKPLFDNLSVVIVRGFSAAIVIFLSTKGGIAVVNNGSNEPNPYVLFFACLIGAVYSERVWDWAKTQIASKSTPPADSATQPAAEVVNEQGDKAAEEATTTEETKPDPAV